MPILVISTSLNPNSLSEALCSAAHGLLSVRGESGELVSLKEYRLPLCDGSGFPGHAGIERLKSAIRSASGILLGVPIYNYGVAASAKNLVELTGNAWEGKVFGLLCASGTKASYMAAMPFVTGLILDYKCLFVPAFLHAQGGAPGPGGFSDPETAPRLERVVSEVARFAALASETVSLPSK